MTCYRDYVIIREGKHSWIIYSVEYDEFKQEHYLIFIRRTQTLRCAKNMIDDHSV